MESLDQLLDKWKMTHDACAALEKKKAKFREKIEKLMNANKTNKYENDHFRIVKRVQNRTSITKKDVPSDIWEKYSTASRIEFITIISKNKGTVPDES